MSGFKKIHDLLRVRTAKTRYADRFVDIEIGFFINLPAGRQPSPKVQVLIIVDQTFKYLVLDFTAGGVG